MASPRRLPNGTWRVQIIRKGLPKFGRVVNTEEEAWVLIREAEVDMTKRRAAIAVQTSVATDGVKTLRDAWAGYKESVRFEDKAVKTRSRETSASVPILRILGDYALHAMTVMDIQHFVDTRRREKNQHGKKLSGDTIRIEKSTLSAMLSWAKKRGYIQANVAYSARDLEMPKCHGREVRITMRQELEMYRLAEERVDRANDAFPVWMRFGFATGTRPGEAAKIKVAWLNLERGEIHLPRLSNKNRRPRVIILVGDMLERVKRQAERAALAGSPYLFWSISTKDGSFKPLYYDKSWAIIRDAVGLPPEAVPHSMRHEKISRLFETTDFSDSVIAALVGDVDTNSLKPYKHLRSSALRERVEDHMSGLREKLEALEKGDVTDGAVQQAVLDALVALKSGNPDAAEQALASVGKKAMVPARRPLSIVK